MERLLGGYGGVHNEQGDTMQEKKDFLDRSLLCGFRLHDGAAEWLTKHYLVVKRLLLLVAYLSFLIAVIPSLGIFRKDAGSLAANLLILLLFLSPLSVIFRARLLLLVMGLRRELGILMGCLALTHGLGYALDPVFFKIFLQEYLGANLFSMDTSILAGLTGLLLITLLTLTSNRWATRLLGGKYWKRLHRVVYPAFVLIVVHRFFRVGGSWQHIMPFIEAVLLVGAYTLLKFLTWKQQAWPWLRRGTLYISEQYAGYRAAQKSV